MNVYRSFASSLGLVCESESFQQVIETIKQVAPTNITVLLTGESGTGKEVIARSIHKLSRRKDTRLLTVNCGAIPEGILESELFGHEKGSFTGAVESRKGYFEQANKGTLFLDEIGEMPINTQVRLLRSLEEKEFFRVGGTKLIHVNVRVIAATNKNLEVSVSKGEFRKDLFYRLNSVTISIPPLRERKNDIRPLAIQFAEMVSRENNIKFKGFSEEAFVYMQHYSWPGNIRELRNIIERILVLEKGRRVDRQMLEPHLHIDPEFNRNLPVVLHKTTDQAERELIYRALIELRMTVEEIHSILLGRGSSPRVTPDNPFSFQTEVTVDNSLKNVENISLKNFEKIHIKKVLERSNGNRRNAAKALGIGERTLYRKLKEYGLDDIK